MEIHISRPLISIDVLKSDYLPMYLRDFDGDPSVGNLHLSTYLVFRIIVRFYKI